MNSNEKYITLLHQVGNQFKQSDIITKQTKGINEWNYALCATPIQKNMGLLLGINWGGKDKFYPISDDVPTGEDIKEYPFIKRCKGYLQKYLEVDLEKINFNYSNFCFFRSPKVSDLSNNDFSLCKPILKEYINYINPPWILSLGVTIVDHLPKDINIKPFKTEHKNILGYKGNLFGYNYFILPHPNYPLHNTYRDEIWEEVFNNPTFMMASRIFLIINSEKEIDLINSGYLLWGSMDASDFITRVSKLFPKTNWNNNEIGLLKTDNAVIEFYIGEPGPGNFETGIMADVQFSDEPFLELTKICNANNWLLFDIDFEKYIPLRK